MDPLPVQWRWMTATRLLTTIASTAISLGAWLLPSERDAVITVFQVCVTLG